MNEPISKTMLPHTHPFVFVDRVLEVEAGKRAVGIKNVTQNEAVLRGHFPGQPVMPGVHIIEALAQIAGIALNAGRSEADGAQTVLVAIRNIKFRKMVGPGDQLILTATLSASPGALTQFAVKAERSSKNKGEREIVAEGELVMSRSGLRTAATHHGTPLAMSRPKGADEPRQAVRRED